jgi:ribosomal protein S18 acetylase RimI-like enzyme
METAAVGQIAIRRCDPLAEKEVLALAALGWAEAERPAHWQAVRAAAKSGQADHVVLLAAYSRDELLAAQISQSLPGRAAVVWLPQFAPSVNSDELAAHLLGRLLPELAATGAQLAQALLTTADEAEARRLAAAGFAHAADLLYLAADVQPVPEERAGLPIEIEPFQTQDEQRLAQLIDRTYVGTLDCPQLDGLRETADVIAGYQSVGEFRPGLWNFVRYAGDDIGCLLVNLHPDVKHAEIVYLGLVPEVRGRGWGLALTRHAQRLAARHECDRVVLAVDAANLPAIRHYSVAGFARFDVRAVWVRPLCEFRNLFTDRELRRAVS